MSTFPVVAREMSVLSRRRSTYIGRTITVGLAMFVFGWVFLVAMAGLSVAQIGRAIFVGLASLSFLYALLAGIHATSDAISEEKREGTLGLLFLTDLRSSDITFGKLAATSLNAFYALIGIIPTLSLAVLLGGVAMTDVARVSLVLANTMFLSLSLGMLVSALSVNERRAIFAALIALSVLTLGPMIITMVATGFESLPTIGIWLSPLYPFLCVFNPTGSMPGFDTGMFFPALIAHHLLGWLCLARATSLLPGFILGTPLKWSDRLAARFDEYVYGSPAQRLEHRRQLLDRNAFLWLSSRERVKPLWAWIVVAIFFTLYLWVAWGFRGILFDLHTSATLLFLVHLVLELWVVSEVCNRIIHDRRSGAMELLLCSPLGVREIARGQDLALRRIFGGPVLVLVAVEVFLMFLALKFMAKPAPADRILTYLAAISTLLLDFWALKWLGSWLCLFGKSMERVLIATVARVMVAPWLIFLGFAASLAAFLAFYARRPEYHDLLLSWWLLSVGFSLWFGFFARRNFLRHCREVVSDQHETPSALAKAALRQKPIPAARKWVIPALARRRPMASAFALIVILLVAGLLVRRIYWGTQLASKLEAIRARNEPTGLLEITKAYPPVSRSKNAFAAFTDAGAVNRLMVRGWDWRILPLSGSNYIHGLDATNREMLVSVLKRNAIQFEALEKAGQFTNAYVDPITAVRNARITDLYGYSDLAATDLMLAIDARDAARAEKALERALIYARLLRRQASTYAQGAAFNTILKTTTCFEALVFRKLLPEVTLARMQTLAGSIDSEDVLRKQLLIARALAIDPPAELMPAVFGQDALTATRRAMTEAIGTRQLQLTRILERFDEAVALTGKGHFERLMWTTNLAFFVDGNVQSVEEFHEGQIRDAIGGDVRLVAEIRLLEAAIAVERYFQKTAAYPASLEALIPEFLPAPPIDPFSGKAFGWRISSEGPMLWSVGPNGKDEGGAIGFGGSADLTFHFWRRKETE
jgi:hypothetical protein